MASWFLPVDETGGGFGPATGIAFDVQPGATVECPPGQFMRIWDTPERCEGWRYPARLVTVEPVAGQARFWSPHVGDTSAVTVLSVADGMPLWGPNGRGVLAFRSRAGTTSDEQAATIAGAWLRIPNPARHTALGALRKTVEKAGRGGASVAARALAIAAFEAQEHRLARRVAEPVRTAIRAAVSCVIVRDLIKDAHAGLTQKGFDLLTSPWQT